jgi:hypothetical protein
MQKIRDCHIYMVLGTDSFFGSAESFAECFYAAELGKPFTILLKKGTEIPEEFNDMFDCENTKYYEWEYKEELGPLMARILKEAIDEQNTRGTERVGGEVSKD